MTQDEIIEMAREAGLMGHQLAYADWYPKTLVAFANFVAAKEREACAKDAEWCIQNHLEHLMPERIRARGEQA